MQFMGGRIQNSFSDQFSPFFSPFFSKIVVNPISWRKLKWWHFRQEKWIHFLTNFRHLFHLFFENPSESLPLAKIKVMAFSSKEVNWFSDKFSRFRSQFFLTIRVNPIPWRKSKWQHFRRNKWSLVILINVALSKWWNTTAAENFIFYCWQWCSNWP